MRKILKISILLISLCWRAPALATDSGDSAGTATSVNNSATTTQAANTSGQTAATMAGAMFAAMSVSEFGKQNYGMGALYAGMAALSLMQAKENGTVAGDAGTTAADTSADGTTTTADTLATSTSSGTLGSLAADSSALKNGINGSTADLATGTVSTAAGQTYSASDFGSASSMANAGFSPDQVSQAMAAAADVNSKIADKLKLGAMTAANGYDEGGGGGKSAGAAAPGADDAAALAAGSAVAKKLARQPADIAGMTKNFNGQPIGVAGENIFTMMTRRYQLKDKQNEFLNATDVLSKN